MTPDDFRLLARSSASRWRALEFELQWFLPERPVRRLHAWLSRPGRMRIESADGEVLVDDHSPPGENFFYENYYWVALLDPQELAAGTDIEAVSEVEHAGRPACQAVLRPVEGYEPRCPCCPLLPSEVADPFGVLSVPRPPDFRYPDRFRARLDRRTGVCVFVEAIGGARAGVQHDLTILAVS